MHELVTGLSILNSISFVVLALVGLRRWRLRRDSAAGWLALSFVALSLIVSVGRLIPVHPHGFPPSRRLQRLVGLMTVGLSVWTFALPGIPAGG